MAIIQVVELQEESFGGLEAVQCVGGMVCFHLVGLLDKGEVKGVQEPAEIK